MDKYPRAVISKSIIMDQSQSVIGRFWREVFKQFRFCSADPRELCNRHTNQSLIAIGLEARQCEGVLVEK